MNPVDKDGNLTDVPPQIQVDRSSGKAWLNSLQLLYRNTLDYPQDSGALNAYKAELQAYNSSYPAPVQAPTDAQSMDYQAAKHLEAKQAFEASLNSSDPRVHQYSRAKLRESLVSVPQLQIYDNEIIRSGELDRSPAHVEVIGSGSKDDDLTPPPPEYFG